jgi:hypothetical protein
MLAPAAYGNTYVYLALRHATPDYGGGWLKVENVNICNVRASAPNNSPQTRQDVGRMKNEGRQAGRPSPPRDVESRIPIMPCQTFQDPSDLPVATASQLEESGRPRTSPTGRTAFCLNGRGSCSPATAGSPLTVKFRCLGAKVSQRNQARQWIVPGLYLMMLNTCSAIFDTVPTK